ncbi:hypothetical protein, partial [Aeromonas taiwanensis]|uniref:hypothetical protein n=1 Tax=Aeromonas taiwanensis TaxID=633417 RepID=UPI003F748916
MNPCILIPCYNHAEPLAAVLARLAEFGLPCLLVDDGASSVWVVPFTLRIGCFTPARGPPDL